MDQLLKLAHALSTHSGEKAAPAAPAPSQSDADYWIANRAKILAAIAAEGYTLMSNARGFQLRKLGKIEAQAAPVGDGGEAE